MTELGWLPCEFEGQSKLKDYRSQPSVEREHMMMMTTELSPDELWVLFWQVLTEQNFRKPFHEKIVP